MFLPYQIKLINNNNRLQIYHKARQTGYSLSLAYRSLLNSVLNNTNQLIVSSSQRQSRIILNYVNNFLEVFKKLKSFKNLRLSVDNNSEKRFLHNDKAVICLPCNAVAVRGFNGDVILDEFCFHRDDEKIYEAAIGCITRGFNLLIVSTGLGKNNLFYKIFTDTEKFKNFYRGKLNIVQAINQGLKVDIEIIKNNMDTESYAQEYMCEFVDEATTFFPYDLLIKAIDDYEIKDDHQTYIGIDIGRHRDNTSVAVIAYNNNSYYLKSLETFSNKMFSEQFEIISNIIKENNPNKVLIDKTGIGMQLSEELEKQFIQVEGIMFNNNVINNLVTFTKKLFEKKEFFIYEDTKLISDFHSISKEITNSNKVTYKSKRDKQGHGDRAWAVMLGLYAAKNISKPKIYFEAV